MTISNPTVVRLEGILNSQGPKIFNLYLKTKIQIFRGILSGCLFFETPCTGCIKKNATSEFPKKSLCNS